MAGDEEVQAIVRRLNVENRRAQARAADAQRRAYETARELAARMGAEDSSLRRVILFGSTVPGGWYRADSDIDLAVDGGDRPFLERLAAGVPWSVDIVQLDDLRPGIRDRVLAEGVLLYEEG